MNSRSAKPVAAWILTALLCILCAQKINPLTADLGRHISNGQWILEGHLGVLSANHYSFTFPDYPFVNHHWLSGVVFHWVDQWFGDVGLSLLYLALIGGAFFLMFRSAERASGRWAATLAAICMIPLVAYRGEVRPEGFSYLLVAVFYRVAEGVALDRLDPRRLFWLAPLMMLWVNLHICFVFGFAVLAAWAVHAGAAYGRSFLTAIAACAVLALINPHGLTLLIYPLLIFKDYGYPIVENQSVAFFFRRGTPLPVFIAYLATLIWLVLGWSWIVLRRKRPELAPSAIAGIFALLAFLALRNFALFGLLALPALAAGFSIALVAMRKHSTRAWSVPLASVILILPAAASLAIGFGADWPGPALGTIPGAQTSAQFFRAEGLRGPIFNNYDIGSYLIHELYPAERVFVDNRPEAYPSSFFRDVYIPMQENEAKWKEQDARYKFNVIYFGWRDATPWAQKFLIDRIRDPDWVPVYVDEQALIFVRQAAANQELIRRFRIPPERFRASPG